MRFKLPLLKWIALRLICKTTSVPKLKTFQAIKPMLWIWSSFTFFSFNFSKIWRKSNARFGFGTVLIYLSGYLDQEIAKWPLQPSSQAATCYYQTNHWKEEAIPLSALPKDTTSKLVSLSSHYRVSCTISLFHISSPF